MDIPRILSNYYKGCEWSLNGENYEGLRWSDKNTLTKPSLGELISKHEEYRAAQPLNELRAERDALLSQTDKYATIDFPHGSKAAKQAWLDYRQALRDLPANTTDFENPVWPEAPST